jgi:hypothetical protein
VQLDLLPLLMEEMAVRLTRVVILQDCVVVTEGMVARRSPVRLLTEEMVVTALQLTDFVVLMEATEVSH